MPPVASSSPLTGTLDGLKRLEAAGTGAVVLPSLFEEDLVEEAREVDALLATGATDAEARAGHPRQVGYGAGAAALELNVDYVSSSPGQSGSEVEWRYLDIVRAVRATASPDRPPGRPADYNAGVDEATASPHRPGQPGSGAGLPPARELELRGGARILVRPILPEDKQRLREGFVRLSAQSRYRRFLTSLGHLSEQQVRYLTEIDYADHMAWVAVDPSRPARPGVGVARYVRLPDEPTAAEAAVTVLDEYQGRGIGTILLRMLAGSARQHGIRSFRGYVLAENAPMMEILQGLGARVEQEGPLLRVDVPIPATADELPDTPTGRLFRSVARGQLPPFRLRVPGASGGPASR